MLFGEPRYSRHQEPDWSTKAYRRAAESRDERYDVGPCILYVLRRKTYRSLELSQLFFAMSSEDPGFKAALHEARQGSSEGGVPIGACLVSADGKILGQGHNMRIQKESATLHVRTASASHNATTNLTQAGRNLHSRDCRSSPRIGLPWCDHVHHFEPMRHVHRCVCHVQSC
jgi:hypothetical protein